MDQTTNGPLGHGAIASPVDPRDWTLASVGAPISYAASCFLDTDWMKPSMQGQIGCCVGCTGEEVVRQVIYLTTGLQCNPGTPNELSWRFVYAVAKCLDGVQDEGTFPALVAKIIRTYGVPLATFCPNDVTLSHEAFVYNRQIANIPAAAFADALTRKSGADMTVPLTQDGIKQAITYAKVNKGGVMILRQVGDSYWTRADGVGSWAKGDLIGTGGIRIPTVFSSGHEEFLTGYDIDPANGRMRVYWLNHWSDSWCSTSGDRNGTDAASHDGGRAWEYADIWLPHVVEMRCVVAAIAPVSTFKYHFTQTLSRGMQGPDVVALQHILMLEGCFPAGQTFTGYYGDLTFAGVVALQQKYSAYILTPANLTHGTGVVGPRTLGWLVNHYGN